MYSLSVSRTFVARHFLTVPDPGPEGTVHSHVYTVEATFEGPSLNEYGYLLDIDDVEAGMDETVADFRDELLNDRPDLSGVNPSAEHLARVFGDELLERVDAGNATGLSVAVHEDDAARIEHAREL